MPHPCPAKENGYSSTVSYLFESDFLGGVKNLLASGESGSRKLDPFLLL